MTAHRSPEERKSDGRKLREAVPRSTHGDWSPATDRPDPVEVITSEDAARIQALVPIRHGRMAVSPFTFYRGAAKIMAGDLVSTPSSGLTAQLCGDAHLSNFGSYASPDRRLVFDVNDFDETLPGPWEWDLKRLATSFVLAGRDNGIDKSAVATATTQSVASYRQAMAKYADQRTLDVWYAQATLDQIIAAAPKKHRHQISKAAAKARSKDSLKAFSKLAEHVDGKYRIKIEPPLVLPLRELDQSMDPDALREQVMASLQSYRSTLAHNRQVLFDRFELVDIALKVVGVGSVGTRCMIVLFEGRDQDDPLFLQIKEAESSVLEDHLPKSQYEAHGERVVRGQQLMQSSSDIFLGWDTIADKNHHFYWRQFHDMKGSADIASMRAKRLRNYAITCGVTLAHAHARSADTIAIAGYLGSGDTFDKAVAEFAFTYADQNDRDYAAFIAAIENGHIEAADG